jgi:hypothetical protein
MSRWGAKEGAREKDEVRGHTVPSVEGMGLRPSKDPFAVHCSVEFPLLGEESAMGHLIGWPPRFSFNIGTQARCNSSVQSRPGTRSRRARAAQHWSRQVLQSRVSLVPPGTPLNEVHYSGPDLSRRALASQLNRCFSLGAGP